MQGEIIETPFFPAPKNHQERRIKRFCLTYNSGSWEPFELQMWRVEPNDGWNTLRTQGTIIHMLASNGKANMHPGFEWSPTFSEHWPTATINSKDVCGSCISRTNQRTSVCVSVAITSHSHSLNQSSKISCSQSHMVTGAEREKEAREIQAAV